MDFFVLNFQIFLELSQPEIPLFHIFSVSCIPLTFFETSLI